MPTRIVQTHSGHANNPELIGLIMVSTLLMFLAHIFMYNRLSSLRNEVKQAFAAVDALLKKRLLMLPVLVEALAPYTGENHAIIARMSDLAQRAEADTSTVDDKMELEHHFVHALWDLAAETKNNPRWMQDQRVQEAENALNDLGVEILVAKREYNRAVREYNKTRTTFPTSYLANFFRFYAWKGFDLNDPHQQRMAVSHPVGEAVSHVAGQVL